MNTTRRGFVLLGLAPLAACAQYGQQLPVWAAGLKAVADTLVASLPALQVAGLSGASATRVSALVGEVETAVGALTAASSTAQGQTTLAQVEGAINALAPLAMPFAAAVPGLGLVIAALPAIEIALNVGISLLTPAARTLASTPPTARRLAPDAALAELLRQTGR